MKMYICENICLLNVLCLKNYFSILQIKILQYDVVQIIKYFMLYFQALVLILTVFNKKGGIRASGLQFLFWLLLTISGVPQFRTFIRQAIDQVRSKLLHFVLLY